MTEDDDIIAWSPTMGLRWRHVIYNQPICINPDGSTDYHKCLMSHALQQLWQGPDGSTEWRDVPTVEDENV